MFPKIATNFVRLQAGALYAKVNTERQAKPVPRRRDADHRHELRARFPEAQRLRAVRVAGARRPTSRSIRATRKACGPGASSSSPASPTIRTSCRPIRRRRAGRTCSIRSGRTSSTSRVSTSGLQHVTWYMIRQIYGDDYWKKFGELNPHAFDSYVQQFDRTVNGQDKVISTAQYSGLSAVQGEGRADRFRQSAGGDVGDARRLRHPGEPAASAGRAAVHGLGPWRAGTEGAGRSHRALFAARSTCRHRRAAFRSPSSRCWSPTDWDAFLKTHTQFVREWDKMTGLR